MKLISGGWRKKLVRESINGMCSSRSSVHIKRGIVQLNDCHRQEEEPEAEAMAGKKKERVMAAAVCVLAILLSAQRLPVGVADPTSAFCQCYVGCYKDCKATTVPLPQDCHDFCCAGCYVPGDPDFDNGCRKSGGKQASICTTEATGDDAAAKYRSLHHGKAKAKHG